MHYACLGLHALGHQFLVMVLMDELITYAPDEVPWCMPFKGNVVLIDETRKCVSFNLEA